MNHSQDQLFDQDWNKVPAACECSHQIS
jgi:hypothetical protein